MPDSSMLEQILKWSIKVDIFFQGMKTEQPRWIVLTQKLTKNNCIQNPNLVVAKCNPSIRSEKGKIINIEGQKLHEWS